MTGGFVRFGLGCPVDGSIDEIESTDRASMAVAVHSKVLVGLPIWS
jgi:hypothetical protein